MNLEDFYKVRDLIEKKFYLSLMRLDNNLKFRIWRKKLSFFEVTFQFGYFSALSEVYFWGKSAPEIQPL
ncbi:MAG: hypothetical protein CM1200mP30_09550 [Pseudomonadota bacterium]|nr:MAG: hypothetical protein CM1200mP30_09550 [Pseudomonadota bacterium]